MNTEKWSGLSCPKSQVFHFQVRSQVIWFLSHTTTVSRLVDLSTPNKTFSWQTSWLFKAKKVECIPLILAFVSFRQVHSWVLTGNIKKGSLQHCIWLRLWWPNISISYDFWRRGAARKWKDTLHRVSQWLILLSSRCSFLYVFVESSCLQCNCSLISESLARLSSALSIIEGCC